MLSPDLKNRIKIKEVFSHPWVVDFEDEYKEVYTKHKSTSSTNLTKLKTSDLITDPKKIIISPNIDGIYKLTIK